MTTVSKFVRDQTGDILYRTKMIVAELNGISKADGPSVSVISNIAFAKEHQILKSAYRCMLGTCILCNGLCCNLQFITNTFQGILITDGYSSYAVFIYECGGMEWGGGEIGWQASSLQNETHYLTGNNSDDIGCLYSSSYSVIVYKLAGECVYVHSVHIG